MNLRPFEIGLIAVFAISAIVGLIYLSKYTGGSDPAAQTYGRSVIVWGTFDGNDFSNLLNEARANDEPLKAVRYVKKDPRTFDADLVNAIAEGKSPDMVILPHTLLATYRSKLVPFTFETLPERTFRDTYIDGAEIFMRSDGIYAIPFAVDPLVMYWNRDILSSSGLSTPPRTWESLVGEAVPQIVRHDDEYALTQSAVALGEYVNILHAKEILSMLFLQAGTTLVTENGKSYSVTLGQTGANGLPPAQASIQFYTQFASPLSAVYSWNRSQAQDRSKFLDGTLALYFGLGSERKNLERDNPNLSFDIAQVPQGSTATTRRNYGTFYGFAIPRASKNITGAYQLALTLSGAEFSKKLADTYTLAPVRRSLYNASRTDPLTDVVYQSALIARGWLDPSPAETDEAFRQMVEEITSGRGRSNLVIADLVETLESLFR